MSVLGMIPARGGSRRLPGKNLALLGGRPLIAHTCTAALDSGVLDAVYVNTDCPRIAEAAHQAGVACPALRPAHLARDETPTRDAVLWMLDFLAERGESYEVLMILQPTSPLRTAEDIRAALRLYESCAPGCVTAVTAATPENWFARCDTAGAMTRLGGSAPLLRINGSIYIHDIRTYRATPSVVTEHAYVMPVERSVDIDTAFDLELCRALLERRQPARAAALENGP